MEEIGVSGNQVCNLWKKPYWENEADQKVVAQRWKGTDSSYDIGVSDPWVSIAPLSGVISHKNFLLFMLA